MAVAYNPSTINWNMLAGIGDDIGQGYQRRALASEMKDVIGPDGTFNYDKAIAVLMQRDPIKGLALATQKAEADAIAGYRQGQLKNAAIAAEPDDLLLWREYDKRYGGGGQSQPSRLSPSVPDAAQNAPSFMFEKFATPEQKAQQKAREAQAAEEGKGRGVRADKDAAKAQYGQQVVETIGAILNRAGEFDDPSFENALGPYQGSTATDSYSQTWSAIPQAYGEARNQWVDGGKNSTFEVRSAIAGDAKALALAIKPMVRGPGEGPWTDADQAQLNEIVGNLTESKTKPEYYRRLKGVVARLNAAFNLNVSVPSLDAALAGKANPYNDEGASWSEQEQPPMDMATDPPPKVQEAGATAPSNINRQELQDTQAMRKQLESMPDGARIKGADGSYAVKRGGKWYHEGTGELLE